MLIPGLTGFFDAIQRQLGTELLSDVLKLRNTPVEKPDGSYVTQGDLLVQEVVLRTAGEHFTRFSVVSEEMELTDHSVSGNDLVLVVDPIDGTENFTSGLPEWGVSIACYFKARHAGSLLGAPELGQWLRTGDQVRSFVSRIRGLSSSLSREQIAAVGVGPEYRMLGCCVVNMMSVIRGSFLSFENPKGANSWDILAGLNLALEHGLDVQVEGHTYAGEYLEPDGKYRFRIEQKAQSR